MAATINPMAMTVTLFAKALTESRKRQREQALMDMQNQRWQADYALRDAAQRAQQDMQRQTMALNKSHYDQIAQDRADTRNQKSINDSMAPFENYKGDPEVNAAIAPDERRARQAATMAVTAPAENDPGVGVVAPDSPAASKLRWGKPALNMAVDQSLENAGGKADDIFARKAAALAAKTSAASDDKDAKLEETKRHNREMEGIAKGNLDNKSRLPPKAIDTTSGYDNLLYFADEIASKTDKIASRYQGRGSAITQPLEQWANADDPEISAYRGLLNNNLADYVRTQSGLAVTDAERKFLATVQPSFGDSPATIKAKAAQFKDWVANKRRIHLENYSRAGYRVDSYDPQGGEYLPPGWKAKDGSAKSSTSAPASAPRPSGVSPTAVYTEIAPGVFVWKEPK